MTEFNPKDYSFKGSCSDGTTAEPDAKNPIEAAGGYENWLEQLKGV